MAKVRYESEFSKNELTRIIEQATVYECACPARLSQILLELEATFAYQRDCMNETDTDVAVHSRIADTIVSITPVVEACLNDVLALEGWDRETLTMPEYLQKRMLDKL